MANKPRRGSDPFQKKDPLGWIGGDQTEKPPESVGKASPTSNPGKPSKVGKSSVPGPSSKTSNPSKHDLPSRFRSLVHHRLLSGYLIRLPAQELQMCERYCTLSEST
jgi:hypothetical protein